MSINLIPFVKELIVDKERQYTPRRVVTKGKGLGFRYTDHYTLIFILFGLPSSNQKQEKQTRWNL